MLPSDLPWEHYEKIAEAIGRDGVEDLIATFAVTYFRPKQPEEITSIYPLSYFKENLYDVFKAIGMLIIPVLNYFGPHIRAENSELYVEMLSLKHEVLTLGNASRNLQTDAQLFDIWQCADRFQKRVDRCLELTPGGVFIEDKDYVTYIIEGEAPSWALWAEDAFAVVDNYEFYELTEFMEERIRAVLALESEENIKALEKSKEEIERLHEERRKLERDNRGMLASLKKSRRR